MEDILLPASPKLAESLPEQVTQVVVRISIPVQETNYVSIYTYIRRTFELFSDKQFKDEEKSPNLITVFFIW